MPDSAEAGRRPTGKGEVSISCAGERWIIRTTAARKPTCCRRDTDQERSDVAPSNAVSAINNTRMIMAGSMTRRRREMRTGTWECSGRILFPSEHVAEGIFPAAPERFDQSHAGVEPKSGELRGGPLDGENCPLRIDDFQICHETGVVARLRERSRTPGGGERAILRRGLFSEKLRGVQRVLHFLKRHEHALPKLRDGFVISGTAALEIRAIPAALENGQVKTRSDRPHAGIAVEQPVNVTAREPGAARQRNRGKERRF